MFNNQHFAWTKDNCVGMCVPAFPVFLILIFTQTRFKPKNLISHIFDRKKHQHLALILFEQINLTNLLVAQ